MNRDAQKLSSERWTAEEFGWKCNIEMICVDICTEIAIYSDDLNAMGSSFQNFGATTEDA